MLNRVANLVLRKLEKLANRYLIWVNDNSSDFLKNGEYELLKRLRGFNFKKVFDIGANTGDWSHLAQTEFPNAEFHLFEISKSTFSILDQSNKCFKVNNLGLARSDGTVLYKDYGPTNGANSTVLDVDFAGPLFSLRNAKVVRGDNYCLRNNIEHIDFLKIDVEGGEYSVLEGFEAMFHRRAIRWCQFEYGYASGDSGFLMRDFYKFFNKFGYKIGVIRKRGVCFQDFEYKLNLFTSGPNYFAVHLDDQEILEAVGFGKRS